MTFEETLALALKCGFHRMTEADGTRRFLTQFAAAVAADALMRYGWHDPQCPYMQDVADCTCGLHDAIAAAGGDVDEFVRARGEA